VPTRRRPTVDEVQPPGRRTVRRVQWPVARLIPLVAALIALALAALDATQASRPLFEFRVSFWNSLHHELHAVSRAKPASPALVSDDLPEAARAGWTRALEAYRSLGRRSLLFDEGLASLSAVLSTLDDAPLDKAPIAPAIRAALEAAAPAYRAAAWPAHQREAQAFIDRVTPLLAQHGPAIAAPLAASYGARWEGVVPVDVVRDAGPPGNAHTTARPRAHVTIAATDPRHQGLAALELLFHEASHGWDTTLVDELTRAARAEGRVIPQDLWHAVLFFAAGEYTRRTLVAAGVAYEPYAVTQGLATGAFARVWPDVATTWTAWIDGKTSRQDAAAALVRAVGALPPG